MSLPFILPSFVNEDELLVILNLVQSNPAEEGQLQHCTHENGAVEFRRRTYQDTFTSPEMRLQNAWFNGLLHLRGYHRTA
ncbi:hypothetical protein BKA82DRAFT_4359677 [Pisolithus tinctorius]|nr:hypothetical protein BKA82DRAFT_4359677 [Pisolithus tinctorius]